MWILYHTFHTKRVIAQNGSVEKDNYRGSYLYLVPIMWGESVLEYKDTYKKSSKICFVMCLRNFFLIKNDFAARRCF